jgi:hypothetical protein
MVIVTPRLREVGLSAGRWRRSLCVLAALRAVLPQLLQAQARGRQRLWYLTSTQRNVPAAFFGANRSSDFVEVNQGHVNGTVAN